MITLPPDRLLEHHRRFVVEEAISVLRHDIRNKLGAVRNASFYLRRKVEKQAAELWQADPRVPSFFTLIDDELGRAETALASRLRPVAVEATCDAVAAARRVAAQVSLAGGAIEVTATGASLLVAGDSDDLAVALYCLVENAADAGARHVTIHCARDTILVEDDGSGLAEGTAADILEPLFTTRPGRLGLGLNIAKRIATRLQGRLEIGGRGDLERSGVRAALLVPATVR